MTSRKKVTQRDESYRTDSIPAKQPRWIIALILAGICIAGFLLRAVPPRSHVFHNGNVVFQETDCWYHVRLIKSLVANFPRLITFDPYMLYPRGQSIPVAPLFDYVVAGACLVAGLGQPSTTTVETMSAFMPPLLGIMVIVLVYFVARRFLGRFGSLLAAALVATLPAHFLRTSRLGFVDHHVLEVLLSTTIFYFLFWGLSGSPEERAKKSIHAGLFAGIALGAYMLAWIGAGLFVGILLVWFGIQLMHDYLRERPTSDLIRLALPLFIVPTVMIAPAALARFAVRDHFLYLAIAIAVVCISAMAVALVKRFKMPRFLFPVASVLVIVIAMVIYPRLFQTVGRVFGIFSMSEAATSVRELAPLLRRANGWTLSIAYNQLTTNFFIALIALPLLFWQSFRRGEPAKILLAIWSLCILGLTLSMGRFTYYYTINVALLCGFLADGLMSRLSVASIHWPTAQKRFANGLVMTLALILCIAPNIDPALTLASNFSGPNDDWIAAMRWLRDETPEPMGDAASYNGWHSPPPSGQTFAYPPSAYSIMSWWDYGYWIIGAGHRIPNANPTQSGASEAGKFFLAQDENAARSILEPLGTRYVVIDARMILSWKKKEKELSGKFSGIAAWAGQPMTAFVETLVQREGGRQRKLALYYPAYYRCLLNRLYLFRGQAVTPEEVFVAQFSDRKKNSNERELLDLKKFDAYDAAVAYIKTRSGEKLEIVGVNPFVSCVPLEKLNCFTPRYQSPTHVAEGTDQAISFVEIYEYVPMPTKIPATQTH